jgi:hypothetical protein
MFELITQMQLDVDDIYDDRILDKLYLSQYTSRDRCKYHSATTYIFKYESDLIYLYHVIHKYYDNYDELNYDYRGCIVYNNTYYDIKIKDDDIFTPKIILCIKLWYKIYKKNNLLNMNDYII